MRGFDVAARRSVGISLFALCAAVLVTAGPAAATTVAAVGRSTTVISGAAGDSAVFRLTRATAMNNAGHDVSLSSPGSQAAGLLIVRTDGAGRYASTDFYAETYATDLGLCAKSPCSVPLQARAWAFGNSKVGDQPIRLSAGTYLAVLLGETGHPVTARIHLPAQPKGTVRIGTSRHGVGELSVDSPTIVAAGRDFDAKGYHLSYSRHRLFVGDLAMLAMGSPGVVNISACSDAEDGPPPTQPTPCSAGATAQFDYPTVLANIGGTAYGTSSDISYGPPDGYYDVGYDISAVTSGVQRIRWATYRVTLPW